MSRLKHILLTVSAIALAVMPLWLDPAQTLVGKISGTIVTSLLMAVNPDKLKSWKTGILGSLAFVAILVAAFKGRFDAGSLGLAILGNLAAIAAQVRIALARELAEAQKEGTDMPKIASILVLFAALGAAAPAKADINLDDIAPKLTKCWGSSTCLLPDAAVNALLFNLDTKKFDTGVVSLGAGLALLFGADQAWASGLTIHATGVLTQETGKSSYAMPSVGLVFFRYIEAAFSYRWSSSEPNSKYISLAGVLPWDVFTMAILPTRAAMARSGRIKLQEGEF